MEILKIINVLTPIGSVIFAFGSILILVAVFFCRTPAEIVLPPTPPITSQPVTVIIIENWQRSSPQTIIDSQGLKAEIETVVLSNDFSWVFKSHTDVQRNGEPANIQQHLMSPGISEEIKKYSDVIAVGAASSEGAETNPTEESNRASYRADQLQLWIKEYVSTSIPVYRLSLGYYKDSTPAIDTSEQRKIVIIGVVRKDESIDLADALKRTLPNIVTFPFALTKYSTFELKRSR